MSNPALINQQQLAFQRERDILNQRSLAISKMVMNDMHNVQAKQFTNGQLASNASSLL